jgi:hypothetical protein
MLSFKKLQYLLTSNNFIIQKIFSMYDQCVYIEVLAKNADVFILYIPSKYEIKPPESDSVFKIDQIEISDIENLAFKYGGEPEDIDVEKSHEEIEINKDNPNDLVKHLEENYNRPIAIKDNSKENKQIMNNIYRQVNRLKFCVQNLKYKLAILFKNYICCIRRDDSVECYIINNFIGNNLRTFYAIVDLETLYEDMNTIVEDVKTVREGIYRVLDKTQKTHSKRLKKMIEQEHSDVSDFSLIVSNKKEKYSTYIEKFQCMLEKIEITEKNIIEKLYYIENKYSDPNKKKLYNDIEKQHEKSCHDTELHKIKQVKMQITKHLLDLKSKREDTFLAVDTLLFDNNVMIDAVTKNMKKASQYTN